MQPHEIIINKRKNGYYAAFSEREIKFVSQYKGLSAGEKLIWINLAAITTLDANLSCMATQSQIAEMVGKVPNTIYKSLRNLVARGFLRTEFNAQKRINTYFLILPKEGLEAIEEAPNRGEKRSVKDSSVTLGAEKYWRKVEDNKGNVVLCDEKFGDMPAPSSLKNIREGIGKISGGPPEKNPNLSINIINNNKKHNIHNTQLSKPLVQNANALFLKFQEKIKEAKKTNPNISLCKANMFAHSCFNEQENALIHQAIILQAKERESEKSKKREQSATFKQKLEASTPVPQSRVKNIQSNLVEMVYENEHFLIEEDVKNQILNNIPNLYRSGKIKGEAGDKPLAALIKEILFYVVKAGKTAAQPISQLKRYYIARKICLNGGWERPAGLSRSEVVARENKWNAAKRKEIETARRYAGITGCV
tara:strand:- start:25571 stop:26833 length:1263 start_codon:yes stop_codon:yes gene_type:complete